MYSCNPGGCSTPHIAWANHYPGPFWIGLSNHQGWKHNYKWVGYQPMILEDGYAVGEDSAVAYTWGDSIGATSYNYNQRWYIDDALARTGDWSVADSANATHLSPVRVPGTSGSVHQQGVVAVSAAGLQRPMYQLYQNQPASTKFLETTRFCQNGASTGAWVAGTPPKPPSGTSTAAGWSTPTPTGST